MSLNIKPRIAWRYASTCTFVGQSLSWGSVLILVQQFYQFFTIFEIAGFVLGRFTVIDHIIGKNRFPEKHCFYQRWIGASSAVSVNIATALVAQGIKFIQVIYRIHHSYVVALAVLLFQFPAIFTPLPVPYKYQFFPLAAKASQMMWLLFSGSMRHTLTAYSPAFTWYFRNVSSCRASGTFRWAWSPP